MILCTKMAVFICYVLRIGGIMAIVTRFVQRGYVGSQNFFTLSTVGSSLSSSRFYSTSKNNANCRCGAELPEAKRLIELFKERNLRSLAQDVKCPYFHSFQFTEANDCDLVEAIETIATPMLQSF